jgi:hypothetical protein
MDYTDVHRDLGYHRREEVPKEDIERMKRALARGSSGVERKVSDDAARILLRDFPALERGESVLAAEYQKRLSDARQAGYSIPSYSHLGRFELVKLYDQLCAKVRGEADAEVLKEISAQNKRNREDSSNIS